jgi:hypothetical protein
MHVESRNNHLNDDQLLETYFLAEDSGHLNPGHLKTCHGCRERFDHLARSLELAYEDAARESDAVFTPDRLQDQRDRVLRRLERQGQSAEVLRFPNRFGSQRAAHRLLGPARRWVAGAAVAGLVAGVFLGFAVDRRAGAPMANARPGALVTPGARQYASAQDEQTLSEIEDALSGPSRRVVELRALDDMTMPAELQEASFIPR